MADIFSSLVDISVYGIQKIVLNFKKINYKQRLGYSLRLKSGSEISLKEVHLNLKSCSFGK